MPSTSSSTLTSTTTITTANVNNNNNNNGNVTEKVGDLRIRFWYSVEHILALNHYQPLFDILMSSLDSKPYDISFTSILQHLPVDLGHLARPLMKIFLKHDLFNDFFRLVCQQYISSSNETSTLFRNQSMASKLMHEMMKFCGSEYLISTLKPVIDLVYAEKKRCEIDPTKLNQGENLEENTRNFAVYAELAFVRVCESSGSCPPLLKNVLNVLREVVNEKYPNKPDISRLAVSSFIIMRFFAAAILNPTQYGLKRKAPDPDVSRTLVLISKILQRLANCVVTQQPLITKEPWLSSVLERFFDDGHRAEMVEFFDSISINNYHLMKSTSSQNRKPEVLKSGLMVEKRGNGSRRRSIKDVFSQKRRFVTLTQKELSWKKEKNNSQNDVEQKGVIPLSEITSVTQVDSQKSSFRVATSHQEIHFQAVNNTDMTDWMILLITHQRRHLFFHNRPCGKSKNMHHHIDIEKELETLHSLLFENIESIYKWKESVEMFDIKKKY
uniref:Uncharacterized protein n=1 Tax=Panagrolaimus superbus TaxID=310955 RepID=A0A914YG48_9BILA